MRHPFKNTLYHQLHKDKISIQTENMYLISIRVGNDWRARLVGAIICNNNGCRSFIKSQTKTVLQQTTNWKIVTNYVARKCDNDGWVNKKMTSWLGCHCPGHLISGQMFIFQGL